MTTTSSTRLLTTLLVTLATGACMERGAPSTDADAPLSIEAMAPALSSVTSDDLLRRIDVLANDSMEGRAPGTPGETKTVRYLIDELKRLGLAPGNPDGTYVQNVPLVGSTADVTASLEVSGRKFPLRGRDEYVASSRRVREDVRVEGSDLVFVGYGVVAPEYGWDDYKDVDVTGKTIVMLINDPAIPLATDSTQLDPAVFNGRAMTYYGRWTYKYEIAAQKGAAAALIIHETGPAGYPFEVLGAGWGREAFDIKSPDENMSRVAVQAWITEPKAREVLRAGGFSLDDLKKRALSKDFRPIPLGGTATFAIHNRIREVQSQNVVAKLPGSVWPDEYVIYSAHWDHLGKDDSRSGDNIFNGAIDNASGTSEMLEIAEAFTKLPQPPARSILFLAVTAEEKGLLGAKYYAENPLYPLTQTVANINMDGFNQWGRTRDIVVIGLGNSTLDDVLGESAATQGRQLAPDPETEKGFYYRSDHFEFAKQGVPALYTDDGVDYIDKPPGYSKQKRDEYTNVDYHKETDQIKSDWDLSGAVEDTQLLFQTGYRVSQRRAFPEWKPGTEFKALRDDMLAGKP